MSMFCRVFNLQKYLFFLTYEKKSLFYTSVAPFAEEFQYKFFSFPLPHLTAFYRILLHPTAFYRLWGRLPLSERQTSGKWAANGRQCVGLFVWVKS
jgi:hypothetical protein